MDNILEYVYLSDNETGKYKCRYCFNRFNNRNEEYDVYNYHELDCRYNRALKFNKIELLEFCLNYMRENLPSVGNEQLQFCKYCHVEEGLSHENHCKYDNATLKLEMLIGFIKEGLCQ